MNDHKTLSVAATIWLTLIIVSYSLLCGCGKNEMSNQVIVQNETFTLTGDSVIEDTVFAVALSPEHIETNMTISRLDSMYGDIDSAQVRFEHGRPWRMRQQRPANIPEYESGQPLIDALYNMSTDQIADHINTSGIFDETYNISRLYCAIYLSLAAIKPYQSMATLRTMVDIDSIIMQREGQWPVVSDHISWATAAWEVYKTTGDRKWLAYSKHVIEKTLNINSKVLLDQTTGLVHGAGYTSAKPLGSRRMTWMGYNDMFACMSLGNNIMTAQAYTILSDMCDELGLENTYDKEAQRLKDAINQYLWNEERGCYSSFLYGMAYPHQSPTTDNTSQALCVLWGIADNDRAENLIANTPVSDKGVNVNYPPNNPLEPYLANSSWTTTQALWNIASAYTKNENALRRGLGALYRAQALYQSQDIHMKGIKIDELGAGASNVAMIMRVFLGMNFKSEGIEFDPIVPEGMPGEKTFNGFNYRKAVLNFTIQGSGNDIAQITDNGKPLEGAFLPNDIEGRHHIIITMKEDKRKTQKATIHHDEVILPLTPNVVWSNDSGRIIDYMPGTHYRLSVNGTLNEINDSVFVLPKTDCYTEYAVAIVGKNSNGFISKPMMRYHLTPQIAFFPTVDGDTAQIKVSVDHGGDYIIDIGYNPTGTLDVRKIAANSHPMGTLVMSSGNLLEANGLAYSNMVRVKLLKGENVITITQLRLPKSFTPCDPVHLRVIGL